jgi:hypothetical protein
MSMVKKTRPTISEEVRIKHKDLALAAIRIFSYECKLRPTSLNEYIEVNGLLRQMVSEFETTFKISYEYAISEIRKKLPAKSDNSYIFDKPEIIYNEYLGQLKDNVFISDKEPVKVEVDGKSQWIFKGFVYEVKGFYADEEVRLLILEDFDRERRYFEKLNAKFNHRTNENLVFERPRIPESVRIEVWRRDGGKCARCGGREKLEYDHIVPISRGGSNSARNIELLCEKCNRSKSNNVV